MDIVSDRATFAWLAEVFVLPERRNQGIARKLDPQGGR